MLGVPFRLTWHSTADFAFLTYMVTPQNNQSQVSVSLIPNWTIAKIDYSK